MLDASSAVSVSERPEAQLAIEKTRPTSSPVLVTIQKRSDSPFGALFLGVPPIQPKALYKGRFVCKVSTKEPEETSNEVKTVQLQQTGQTTMTTGRTRKKILIMTQDDDGHAEPLIAELERLGCPWVRVDPASFPSQVNLIAHLTDGDEWSSMLHLPSGEILRLEEVRSVWYRRPNPYTADAALPSIERELIIQESQYGLGGLFRSIPGLWVNHPEVNRTASYKPLQLQVARKLGFSVPRTLITNSPEAFQQFYSECNGNVVYKLLGHSIFWDEGIPISAYTSLVPPEMLGQAPRLTKMAHLFQEYVDKLFELRITVIGEWIFAAEIYSQHSEKTRVDFRQQYADLRYGIHQLPETIQTGIMALMRFFGLQYGAIDMVVTPEGDYQFIEINPNGQFAWIEAATDLPLFRTLALLLATGQIEEKL